MADDGTMSPENWENARNALAYLNAQLIEETDDTAQQDMSIDFVVSLMNEDPTSESIENTLAKLAGGLTIVAKTLILIRAGELNKTPSQTLEELGQLLAKGSE